jgi:diacylglycerol kinase family enzyme
MTPFLLINAGSGGGRTQDSIAAAAAELKIDHHVVEPGDNFNTVLTAARNRGADLLAAAGGDGTLCAVAKVAMDHGLPMVVVPAGTRNHFALDLGLDLEDPVGVLRACITSGHERRVDVGTVNGSTFLNNASLGVYATAVGSGGYRRHKVSAVAKAAREAVSPDEAAEARLTLSVPGSALIDLGAGSASVMVVNNAYAPAFAPGARLRPRLDAGEVWVYFAGGMEHDKSGATALVHVVGAVLHKKALRAAFGVDRVEITSNRPDVPIAIDGELRPDLLAPFEFASRSGALRLIVPSDPAPRKVEVILSW